MAVATLTILFALGYRANLSTGNIYKSGLVVMRSFPTGAYITINDELQSDRTSARITLPPGDYDLKVDREDVIPWKKRVDLEPGQALLEEDILLFLKDPPKTVLAPSGPATLTADGKRAVTSTPGSSVSVRSFDLTNGSEQTIGSLPTAFAESVLNLSDDGSRVVAVSGTTAAITGDGIAQPLPILDTSAARFVPGNRNQVVIQTGTTLLRIGLNDGSRTPFAENVRTWTTTKNGIYVESTNNALKRYDPGNLDGRTLVEDQVITDLTPTSGSDAVFARTDDRDLLEITPSGMQQVAERIDRFATNGSGDVVALVSSGELSVWRKSDQNRQLVTRSSVPYDDLAIITDGHYLLYIQAGQVHSIAIDGSNDQVLQPAGGPLLLGIDTTLVRRLPEGVVKTPLLPK